MADLRRRHPKDAGGAWFVDTTCIACDVARLLAPGLIAEDARGLSYFTRAPSSPGEDLQAWRALLACPSASIGAPPGGKAPAEAFPWELTPGVSMLGYNARHSFGATAWLLTRPDGNVMIDAPRWTPRLADAIDAMGGLAHVFLTHRDDVADFAQYAERFGARVHIHEDDADAAPGAKTFAKDTPLAPGLRILVTPGHTQGSAMLLADERHLFTGDSLEWSRETQDLAAFRDFTWYSWERQKESLARLAEVARFEWVFPGHGGWGRAADMDARLRALVASM